MRSLVLLAIAVALAGDAHGYTIDEDENGHPLRWWPEDIPVRYALAAGNVPEDGAGASAVHAAAETWSAVSEGLSFAFAGFVDRAAWGRDQRNMLVWIERDWPFDETLVATTIRVYGREDGRILEADSLFNAEDYAWGAARDGVYDVESVAAHELGHIAGLGHSEDPAATMFASIDPADTSKRTVEGDDRHAIAALYGEGAHPATGEGSARNVGAALAAATGVGGCTITRRREGSGLWLAAAILFLAGRRRRAPGRQGSA